LSLVSADWKPERAMNTDNVTMKRHPMIAARPRAPRAAVDAGNAQARPHVYRVGPWRQAIGWMFVPAAAGLAIAAMFADAPDERAGLWTGAAMLALVTCGIVWMIRRARLEAGPDGIVLRQIGFRLESTWANVVAVRTDRGHEGFMTAEPVSGKGMSTVAAAASVAPYGMYDGVQQALLDQHRFIPIEAFAWHLRKGTLRRDINAWAPHLANDLMKLDIKVPRTPEDRRGLWLTAGIIALCLAFSGLLIALGDRVQAVFFNATYALLDPLLVASSAAATWSMIRRRSWLMTVLMGLLTLVMIGWTIVDWTRLLA
jgi:hypothetical protein